MIEIERKLADKTKEIRRLQCDQDMKKMTFKDEAKSPPHTSKRIE